MNTLNPVSRILAGLLCIVALETFAADQSAAGHKPPASKPDVEASTASNPKEVGAKVRESLGVDTVPNKKLTLTVGAKAHAATDEHGSSPARSTKRRSSHKKNSAHAGEAHWAYEGENGPQTWARLKAEFSVCGMGKRQSPINIESGTTLQGPAEPVQFSYTPSSATVVNNGHTIQVDVQGDNSITVRGSTYRLVQFHFHTPSEEQINARRFPMVAHLVHKNAEGQLAVVAVLLDTGGTGGNGNNMLIDKVWTYMPLDNGDRVRMPPGLLNLYELLPSDPRYYQFMGSLTTPPCTEGVLWIVFKQPATISQNQYRLFTQIYANNARPVQALNGRAVREAQ
ncbi:MAG: carbonic anhydrase family protein [Rhodoferax sp.]|nr:carbonic anhydrase family protein [Rhodoferax sp.]